MPSPHYSINSSNGRHEANPMRVTLVGAFPPQAKGEAHYLGEFATALRRSNRIELSIVSQYRDKPSIDRWNGFEVRRDFFDRSLRPSFGRHDELLNAVVRTRPDMVHVHYGPNQDYGGRLGESLVYVLRSLRNRGIKVVLTLHSLWLPRDVLDSPPAQRLPSFARFLVPKYFGWLMRSMRRNCDEFACLVSASNSPMTTEFARAYGVEGVLEEVHGCRPRFSEIPGFPPVVLSFGFLRPDKGFEYLIDAFGRYVSVGGSGRLLIVGRPQTAGDAPYAQYLQRKASEILDGRCTVEARFCSDEELESFLHESSLIVLPYLRNVGASGPLHHALGVGRPIITTNVGHNRALAGITQLVEPASAETLAESLSAMLRDRASLLAATNGIRAEAAQRSWDRLADRYVTRYFNMRAKG